MGELLVLNKDADTAWYVDATTGERLATLDTAFNPHEVVVTPDGTKAFVTCSLGDELLVVDNDERAVIDRFTHDQFDFPHGLAIRESAGELWLASTYSDRLFVFDLDSHELLETIATHQDKSHMVTFAPDESQAYVANIGSDSITVVDCDERRVIADPLVGEKPEGIATDPTTGEILVANQDDGQLSVLDPETYESRFALLGETPIRVVVAPDDRHVLVPNRESNDVSVIDTAFHRDGQRRPWEVARVPVGIHPGGTVFDPTGGRAFTANNKTNDISVIDTDSFTETERFDAGIHPDGIDFIPE